MGNLFSNLGSAVHNAVSSIASRIAPQAQKQATPQPPPPPPPQFRMLSSSIGTGFSQAPSQKLSVAPKPVAPKLSAPPQQLQRVIPQPQKAPPMLNITPQILQKVNKGVNLFNSPQQNPSAQMKRVLPKPVSGAQPFIAQPVNFKPQPNLATFATGIARSIPRAAMSGVSTFTGKPYQAVDPASKFIFGNEPIPTGQQISGNISSFLQQHGISKGASSAAAVPLAAGSIVSEIFPFLGGAEKKAGEEAINLARGSKDVNEFLAGLKEASPEVQQAVHNVLTNPNTKIQTLADFHKVANSKEDAGLLSSFSKKAGELQGEAKTPEQTHEVGKSQSLPSKETAKSSSSGSIPPQSDPVKQVIKALEGAKPIRAAQEGMYSAERAKRFAKAQSVGQRVGGEKGFYAQLGQMKGALPKAEFESIKGSLTQSHIDSLFQQVRDTKGLNVGEQITAQHALTKLLGAEGGSVPTEGEIKLLGQVFGNDLVKAILDKRPFIQKLFSATEDALSIPRSLMATADFSASLRQAIFAAPKHPVLFGKAFGAQFKYAFSEKQFQGLLKGIREGKNYQLMKRGELAITDAGNFINDREEKYASSLAEKIPGIGHIVRGSDRAYTGLLTKFRSDLFNSMVENAKIVGKNVEHNDRQLKAIGHFVNTITGRGQIDTIPGAKSVSGFLNATLFSPRLLASRINLLNPLYYASQPKGVRQEALKTLFAFTATVLATLSAVKVGTSMAGKPVQIETDPTSADFGKIKVGNTRYEITGGFQPYVRLAAQLITGQTKSTTTGKVTQLGKGFGVPTRGDTIANFLKNKENPILSFATDLATGKNSIGQPFDLKSEVVSRVVPLLAQDAYDIFQDRGLSQTLGVTPGIFGVGVQTYGGTPKNLQDAKQGGTQSTWQYVKSLPPDEQKKVMLDGSQINDREFSTLKTYREIDKAGLSQKEYNMVGSNIKNGDRAKLMWDQMKNLPYDQQKQYVNKLDSAGLLGKDDTVFNQLKTYQQKEQPKNFEKNPVQLSPTPTQAKTTTLQNWDQFKQIADTIGKAEDFPPQVIKAVAAVESARGTSTYAKDRNNFFGYNAVDANPDLASNFPTVEDGIKAYVNLIKEKYPDAYAARKDPQKMIKLIKQGGYASDPNYVSSVTGTPEFRGS